MSHISTPFHTLREAGVQADLRDALQSQLKPFTVKVMPPPLIQSGKIKSHWCEVTSRVALEMKLTNERAKTVSMTDIVVLRHDQVELKWGGGGPGDVLARIEPENIVAAIEVKASPSNAEQQRRYLKDIQRLVEWNKHGIAGFFVLADKSLPLYGSWHQRKSAAIDWLNSTEFEEASFLANRKYNDDPFSSAHPSIEVWDIEFKGNSWRPRCRFI